MTIFKLRAKRLDIKQNSAGFTLVELILGMGLFTILLGVLLRVFVSSVELRLESEAESAVTQDARFLVNRMRLDTRQASAIIEPALPGVTSQNLRLEINGVEVEYLVNTDNKLVRREGVEEVEVVGSGARIAGMNVEMIGEDTGTKTVRIEANLESVGQTVEGRERLSVEFTAGPRL